MKLIVDNLSRTIRTPVWCLIVIIMTIVVEVSSLSGPNVCTEKQKYNITKRVKYRAPMSVRTYEWCFAMPPRCSKWNTEMRDLTRLETEERTAEMVVCCPGFKLKDTSCVPICPHGKTGNGCSEDCPPNKWGPSCMNDCKKCKHGNCSPYTGVCLCQNGWQGESCETIISTTTPAAPVIEQILTSVKTTASTKPTSLSTITLSTTTSTIRNTAIVTTASTSPMTSTVSTTTVTPSTTNLMNESKTSIASTVSEPVNVYKNMTLSDISSVASYKPVNDEKTEIHLVKNAAINNTKPLNTSRTAMTAITTLSSESTASKTVTEYEFLPTTETEITMLAAKTTLLPTVIPKTSPTTQRTTNSMEKATRTTETTRNPEMTLRQPTTVKFKPKEIWIRPAQKGESPIIESKVKTNHGIPHSRSKTREISTVATTPKTIMVSIIPTSVSYSSFKRIALSTTSQTSQRINASIKSNDGLSTDQIFTKPMTVKTTTSTPFSIKVQSRKPNSSTSNNPLLLQNVTRAKSYTSFSTKGTFEATTLPAAPTTNSMPGTWNVANKKLNSSLLTTVFSPSINVNPTTRNQNITTKMLSHSSHMTTAIKTEPTLSTLSTRITTAYPPINKQHVTVAQRNITMKPISSRVSEVPQVTKTLVRKQADTNVFKQNLTKTNAKSNTVTEDPTTGEETFHILTEPEHITAVMDDKEKDRSSLDLISVISIAGGVMMAIITVAVVIVMVERCKKPRYEDVRKYNSIRMQVMIDKNDVPPPPYVRSIFHTPLPEPPTSEKCHYQPISTLDRNLKQFMRPVVVQTISPLMLENFRGILECHYDHLPRRSDDLGTMQARCSVQPSMSEREELLPQCVHSLTDSDIEAMKCEAKQDVIDNTTSEPLYAEIPCWRPPSQHAIEVVNLNGEAVTEL